MEKNFLNLAINEALKAKEKDEVPIGAVIVIDGKVISKAHNLCEKNKSAICHAEILAIKKACKKIGNWRLSNAELYVTLEPCLMCLGAIFNCRIKAVYFGANDDSLNLDFRNKIIETNYANHKVISYINMQDETCKNLIKDFFKFRRNNRKSDL